MVGEGNKDGVKDKERRMRMECGIERSYVKYTINLNTVH